MTFTRTVSGLANYPKFYGVDVIAYTEGKLGRDSDDLGDPVDDVLFYSAILKTFLPEKKVRIKCVGSKNDAIAYAHKIDQHKIKNEIVLVDRDLWTIDVCEPLVKQLMNTSSQTLRSKFQNLSRRMRFLAAMDAALQIKEQALLNKTSAYGGVGLRFDKPHPVTLAEVRRLRRTFAASNAFSCPTARLVLSKAAALPANRLVQGHLWASMVCGLLTWVYRDQTADTAPSKRMLRNLALSYMAKNTRKVIGANAVKHYRTSLKAALTIG